ncbi:RNA-binding post-transcriptional regulator cip2 [Ceratocystis platani]|uniref:RNA-binding post-transcriptional regulator cip2 n=1 Tax=Ceratocystis fimbriata f. sp. platani TaxID=88771 RepID=A0A0F8CP65_CERFI|nr:RNA-binding post-transcriptional regulator cip2 [Ceratocystis platani]
MSTQPPPPHDIYVEYHQQLPPPSRSPNNSRPSPSQYTAPGFASTMTLPRHAQRGYETLGSSALYTDHLSNGYRSMDHLSNSNPPSANPASNTGSTTTTGGVSPANSMAYGYENPSSNNNHNHNPGAWAYSAGNVATINGSLNGASRQRPMARRAALPTGWADNSSLAMHSHSPQSAFAPHSLGSSHSHSHLPAGLLIDQAMSAADMRGPPAADSDQLIPTAIVIKNIPFAVRKEQLAQIMVDMNLPQPYAFNYHFDNGVFRGLAFANFQNPEDTRAVIERMNGLDVSGRKLRVEYKKMLPEAERERIEREKRERRGQLEEQHRAPMLHQQPSLQSLTAASTVSRGGNNNGNKNHSHNGGNAMNNTSNPSSSSSTIPNVDLNDPNTLGFYTELTLFKRDDSREILVFPPTISPEDRRQIHIIAHHMGLEHRSVGETDVRQLHIYKKRHEPSPTGLTTINSASLDAHRRGLSRAATFDFATDQPRVITNYSSSHAMHRPGPTIEYPMSAEPTAPGLPNNLRAAKSFADLRSMSPSPSANSTSGGYLNTSGLNAFATTNAGLSRLNEFSSGNGSPSLSPSPTLHLNPGASGVADPTMGLSSSMAGLGLGYDPAMAAQVQAQAQSQSRAAAPGAIGSQRPGARPGSDHSTSRNVPDRQPRNPEWSEQQQTGFSGRGARAANGNGHMARGSDSSDNTRSTTATTGSRFH